MKTKKAPQPSPLEMSILSLLWDRGPMTVREVLDSLPDQKKRAYTSVLSVLQVMEKKGLVGHSTEGPAHRYSPKVQRGQVLRPLWQNLIQNLFGGKPSAVFQSLVQENEIDAQDWAEIDRVMREHKTKGGA